ncbi:ATP-binding cassette domain-containing protein [Bacillus sp. ISL-51]|uniref:ABC transporter ATP-binding protein n=1 Tax=Bacteria TaxID=2 RepID=UPI001BE7B354|nr:MULTISPECIES: ATP-binding cassette domain-containing protein [Bacteria]MBT2574746.1 ATP-binding cassette domain-containing protein [Bacillus sp. ISL-51]MBT2635625.1 ATP-binding cassette domain-containing protein [Bacillus sp. ISL-26]MBT2714299.1 ATP-binding cassette domain-containing protein [Pseudomonas sp. ISL-88]
MIEVNSLTGGYGERLIVKDVNFTAEKGEFLGILGPNGSGKTTLMKLLTGMMAPAKGNVLLCGRPVGAYKPRELAKIMAVLPQHTEQAFTFTVKETVSFGRYPFQKGLFRQTNLKDEEIVQEAMEMAGIAQYAHHPVQHLSGGERQRVYLAQALAQQPDILCLDEPTTFLDLKYQKDLLDIVKRLTREKGLTAVSIFHDLNAASQYCDYLLMMKEGCAYPKQPPEQALAKQKIEDIYGTNVSAFHQETSPKPLIAIVPEDGDEKGPVSVPFSSLINKRGNTVTLHTDRPLRLLSTAADGTGFSWSRRLVSACGDKENDYVCRTFDSVCIAVTAHHSLWVLVSGSLSDQAFARLLMAASEARTQALFGKQAKGDIIIAASQTGHEPDVSHAEQIIRRGVKHCVKAAEEGGI